MISRLVIWVTSDCNLTCKWCSQKYTMTGNKGYQMSLDEVNYIVNSCKDRNIHLDVIEITGGEVSLWKNIKEGVKLFSQICDTVTLVTNGNNPELILSLGLKSLIVSSSQATKKQLVQYIGKPGVSFNAHTHRKLPDKVMDDKFPVNCNIKTSPEGFMQNNIFYLKGNVYYCCNTFALSEKVKPTEDMVCKFEDDFLLRFNNKKYDKEICHYCLCNDKIWKQLTN